MERNAYRKFVRISSRIEDPKLRDEFFDLFLTSKEREDIGQRVEIVCELLKGENSQRAIAKKLSTSIAKITRGSNCLKAVSAKLKDSIKKFSDTSTTN